VNELTGEVYGHIVSMDAFGEAYVVPIQSILRDIQALPGVEKVELPTTKDVPLLQNLYIQLRATGDPVFPLLYDFRNRLRVRDAVSYLEPQYNTVPTLMDKIEDHLKSAMEMEREREREKHMNRMEDTMRRMVEKRQSNSGVRPSLFGGVEGPGGEE
jgi:hypothetical protein